MKIRIRLSSMREIIWIMILVWFFEPLYFDQIGIIDITYTLMRIIGVIFVLLHLKHLKIDFIIILGTLINIVGIISTYLAGSSIVSVVNETITIITLMIIVNLMMDLDYISCIKVMYIIFEILIYINVLSFVLFPEGLYNISRFTIKKYYFLGHQNEMAFYSLSCITLGRLRHLIDMDFSHKRILAVEIVSLFYAFGVWSVNSIIAIFAISLFDILSCYLNKKFHISMLFVIVANFVLLFFLNYITNYSVLFKMFVTKVLKRDITFTGRTIIWKNALIGFLNNPILGNGKEIGKTIFGINMANTAHSLYMNILFTEGIVGAFILVVILLYLSNRLNNNDNRLIECMVEFFTVFLLSVQVESGEGAIMYFMLVIASRLHDVYGEHNRLKWLDNNYDI